MQHKIACYITSRICKHADIPPESERAESIAYGAEVFINNTIRIPILYIIAFFLHIIPQVLVSQLTHTFLRKYSFGRHAHTFIICTIISFTQHLGTGIFVKNHTVLLAVKIIGFICCSLAFIRFSPADTKNDPIPFESRSYYCKKSTIRLLLVILVSMCFALNDRLASFIWVSDTILIASICQAISILPSASSLVRRSHTNNGGKQ